ncbi:MAG: hypothetical protein CME06_02455 [Gemmatimonadetes bacterium]|nr:hypothetical protein [Gemmatimonadota bacterium]
MTSHQSTFVLLLFPMICATGRGSASTSPLPESIYVPDDYETIQGAVDAAEDGDKIIVRPGTYPHFRLVEKSLTVESTNPNDSTTVKETVVDGGDSVQVLAVGGYEPQGVTLAGLTFTRGYESTYWSTGGGIDVFTKSAPSFVNCRILDSYADRHGGGVFCGVGTTPLFVNCTIEGNVAERYGGGVYVDSLASATFINCVIRGNDVELLAGGGIYVYPHGTLNLESCHVTNNVAAASTGGGLYAEDASIRMEQCTVEGNTAAWWGGGVVLDGCDFQMSDSVVASNHAELLGGLYLRGAGIMLNCHILNNSAAVERGGLVLGGSGLLGSKTLVRDCLIAGNTAPRGAGISCWSNTTTPPIIENTWIRDNHATYRGGGVVCENASATIRNCLITDNTAAERGAGMVFYEGSDSVLVRNCTFADNDCLYGGGGIDCDGGSPTLLNCVFWGNTPNQIGIIVGAPSIRYSDVVGGWAGEGNIDAAPLFRSRAGYDYLLAPSSPCVDAGDPSIADGVSDWHPLWPARYPNDARSDMGAYGGPGNWRWLGSGSEGASRFQGGTYKFTPSGDAASSVTNDSRPSG